MKPATTNTTTTLAMARVDGVAPDESFEYKPFFFVWLSVLLVGVVVYFLGWLIIFFYCV